MSRISRRRFLLGAAASAVVAAGGVAYSESGGSESSPPPAAPRQGPTTTGARGSTAAPVGAAGPELPTAAWLMAENSRPGTLAWLVTSAPAPHAIEGYADRVSATAGDTVTLYVNTAETTFHVEAYRMGWYQGLGGRLVWQSGETPGQVQPPPQFTPGINMIECHWAPSLRFGVTTDWPPGNYLLKLVGSSGHQQFVPLTVRDDNSTAAVAVMNSVTTWQAYNLWHGYSLYYGVQGHGQAYATRSRVVSFDRPYGLAGTDWANGASDWMGNEFPFLMLAEKWGLDLAYLTDIDLATDWTRLLGHKLLVSLGHDEYWSKTMLDGALLARDEGVNFAFLGANACFRHIRLDVSATGPNRHVVCYKDAAEDPMTHTDPADSTADWPSGPVKRPESLLIGNMYQSNPVDAALVCADPSAWGLAGTGMAAADSLPHAVGSEYDAFDLSVPGPRNVEIWCHSPLVCRGVSGHSDVTYYSATDAGGVFATGSNWWVNKLADGTGTIPTPLMPSAIPDVTSALTQITRNVMTMLGSQPGGLLVPSKPNWSSFYSSSSGAPTPRAVPAA